MKPATFPTKELDGIAVSQPTGPGEGEPLVLIKHRSNWEASRLHKDNY